MQERMMALSERALEMVMRDVLEGLEDLALSAALASGDSGCQILSISDGRVEAPHKNRTTPATAAEVIDLDVYRKVAGI